MKGQKMVLLLLVIAALAVELVTSDADSAETRRGQWGQGGNQWGQGGNQWGQGGNQWGQGGNQWGQGGNLWNQRRQGGNGWGSDSNSNARLAICRFLDRCPNAGEVNSYATSYNGRTQEMVRVLADSGDFEQHFIANKQDACQTLYRKLLDRNIDHDGEFLCSKIIPALGYRWLKNQLIDSSEYQQKFGTTTVPGYGQCPRDCAN